jgi:phytoene dehydrogenase-like protein
MTDNRRQQLTSPSIIIIGAGMGGMAAGIYGELNGFSTQIFEAHALPGGQCAAWKRKGYTFDGCIHHLMGCDPNSRLYRMWEELGAMPRQLRPVEECVSVCAPDGRVFRDYYDPARLRDHLLELAPGDPAMAPAGKGVIKVELHSTYSYWKALAADRARYDEEKARIADTVIGLLERRFPGLRGQVEAVDVPTLLTWERYMGGTHGFANMPKKPFNFMKSLTAGGMETTLPGLERFHFAGAWATSAGALFMNALSGRVVVKAICKAENRPFTAPHRL